MNKSHYFSKNALLNVPKKGVKQLFQYFRRNNGDKVLTPKHYDYPELSFLEEPTNLDNLKLLDPTKVKQFVEDVNNLEKLGNRKLIIGIGTGGTIAMKERVNEQGEVVLAPALNFEDIFNNTEKRLNEKFYVKSFDAFQIDSCNMHIDNVHDLAIFMSYCHKHIKKRHLGFLIVHGTDTMAQAASYMTMMMGQGLPFPIVYTGAQRPISHDINDAAANVKHALYTLYSMYNHETNSFGIRDVAIVAGDAVLLVAGAQKISDKNKNAFDTHMHELLVDLSNMTNQPPFTFESWIRKEPVGAFAPEIFGGYSHVLELHSKMSMSPEQIVRQIQDETVRAIALVTYGATSADIETIKAIEKGAKAKNIPAFAVSPVDSTTQSNYDITRELIHRGIHPAPMTLHALTAKAELAIRKYQGDVNNIVDMVVHRNYIGEIPNDVCRRRSPLLRH